jgi:uncharacterized protein with von Willebrand factor type A (vWA) domain
MFKTDGVSLIEKALSQFDSVKAKLAEGVEQCKARISQNEAVVVTLQTENQNLANSAKKAERAMVGIDKLLNGE